MEKTKVYPHMRWDGAANAYRVVQSPLATLEKIASLSAEAVSDAGQEVDSDRIFDGWFIPREYKTHLLHVVRNDDQSHTIHIYGNDGRPSRSTMKFSDAAEAFKEACKVIDHGGGR